MKKRYGYIRESSAKQVTETKNGINAQLYDIKAWAIRNDIDPSTIDLVIDSAKTGRNINRNGIQEIIDNLKQDNVEFIVTQTDDRMMRNLKETVDFMELQIKSSAKLIVINGMMDYSTATNTYMTNQKAAANQFWSDKTSEDTIDRIHAAAMNNRYARRGCPRGWIKNETTKRLEIDFVWVPSILMICEKIHSGEYGLRSLSLELEQKKVMNVKWTENILRSLVYNQLLYGAFFNKNQDYLIRNHSPAFIDETYWNEMIDALSKRKNFTKQKYIFKHKVYCTCGSKREHTCCKRPYHYYKYYYCTKCKSCINEDLIARNIFPLIQEQLKDEKIPDYIAKHKQRLSRIDFMLEGLKRDLLDDKIDEERYKSEREELLFKRTYINGEIRDLEFSNKVNFSSLDYYSKKDVIAKYVENVIVDPSSKDIKVQLKKIEQNKSNKNIYKKFDNFNRNTCIY